MVLAMARVHFQVNTKLSPGEVLAALTDFGPRRSQIWPNIDDEHFKLHDQGTGWAEVTEGSSVAGGVWEREKYTWNAGEGTVAVETLESNTWGPGSRWDYKIAPGPQGGAAIDVTVERHGMGLKGRLIEAGLAVAGGGMLRSQMEQALKRSTT
jgi:hypothetical protein